MADTGRTLVGETAVKGANDREENMVAATVIQPTDAEMRQGSVKKHADSHATVNTSDPTLYEFLRFDYDSVWQFAERLPQG